MKLIRSAIRVFIGVVIFLTVVVGAFIAVIHQPIFSKVPFDSGPRADTDRLQAHVNALAVDLLPRHYKNLDVSAKYIQDSFSASGAKVLTQPFYADSDQSIKTKVANVIAKFGSDSGPLILVGAHYDAYSEFPGADDNASAVAGLLELGRLLSFRQIIGRIELVAYATEEPPFFASDQMGSAVHALELSKRGEDLKAMICLEMIGYFGEKQSYPLKFLNLLYPSHGFYIAIVGRWEDRSLARQVKRCFKGASDLETISYSGPQLPGADLSDHRNYWSHGYSAVMITDTAFLRNPYYHTPEDTPDTLDYKRMAKVVDGILNSVLSLCQ